MPYTKREHRAGRCRNLGLDLPVSKSEPVRNAGCLVARPVNRTPCAKAVVPGILRYLLVMVTMLLPIVRPAKGSVEPDVRAVAQRSASDDESQPEQAPESPADSARRSRSRASTPSRVFGSDNRDSASVRRAFRSVVAGARKSTVEVISGGRRLALGTIVDADGYVLTKSSQVLGEIECRLSDDQIVKAAVVRRDSETDLAMLKLESEQLPVVDWSETPTPAVGTLLVTPGIDETPLAFGVAGVPPRKIKAPAGILGVLLEQGEKGPRIAQVLPGSGASSAGLKIDDVVLSVNGTPTASRDQLLRMLGDFRAGDQLRLMIFREEETVSITANVGARLRFDPAARRAQLQNSLGGPLSSRRTRFPLALQHDTFLRPNDCGGPLVDLDGAAVGINIARAGRVSSLALPVQVIKPLIKELKSGKLAPDGSTDDVSTDDASTDDDS